MPRLGGNLPPLVGRNGGGFSLRLVLPVFHLRSMLFDAVPKYLRSAIGVGIEFFITIIGLKVLK